MSAGFAGVIKVVFQRERVFILYKVVLELLKSRAPDLSRELSGVRTLRLSIFIELSCGAGWEVGLRAA